MPKTKRIYDLGDFSRDPSSWKYSIAGRSFVLKQICWNETISCPGDKRIRIVTSMGLLFWNCSVMENDFARYKDEMKRPVF